MYRNIEAELVRKGTTKGDLAKALGITQATLSLKLNGKYEFSIKEAKKIKETLGIDMSLDELFLSNSEQGEAV